MSDDLFKEEFKRFRSSRGEFAADEVIDFENVKRFGASQVTNGVIFLIVTIQFVHMRFCRLVCQICLLLCRHATWLLKNLGYYLLTNGKYSLLHQRQVCVLQERLSRDRD